MYFIYCNIKYNSLEQCYHHTHALMAKALDLAKEIYKETDGVELKNLSKRALRETRPLRTFDFGKRAIKVCKCDGGHLYITFPRHLPVHQRLPCPASGKVL